MRYIPLFITAIILSGLAGPGSGSVRSTMDAVRQTATPDPSSADTIHVAPPAGIVETDRANVQAAFDEADAGDTVLFAPGTYMLGAGVKLTVPDVTVLGHREGTVLRGCDPEAFDIDEANITDIVFGCTGLYVQTVRQTIRDLTFEYTWHGIVVGPYPTSAEQAAEFRESGTEPADYPAGGHLIEGNTFRAAPNGMRVLGSGEDVSIVRDNDFIDVFHAIGMYGAPLHFLDNRVVVEQPDRVPFSRHPGSAVLVSPGGTDCSGQVVAGNVIEGYPDPVYVNAYPGEHCRGVEIRRNTIRAARVRIPNAWGGYVLTESDSSMVGIPITLMGMSAPPSDGSAAVSDGTLEDILIEDNRILGGEGLGILIQSVSNSRVLGNTITEIERRVPFPGISWDGVEPGWTDANGSAIWISQGSSGNEITGNTFEQIAAYDVFLGGDSNHVRVTGPDDAVRDLGTGNSVTTGER